MQREAVSLHARSAFEWAMYCQALWGDYHGNDDRQCVWKLDIGEMNKLYCGCCTGLSTETPGDIASANYFYLHTLWMNCCVLQHIKSPFVAYEEARHRKVTGLQRRLHYAGICHVC